MPFPVGMVTRDVTFPAVFDTSGDGLLQVVRVTPSRAFVWAATGEAFLPTPQEGRGDGVPITLPLPVPGQPGFVDGAGNVISDWTYTAVYSGPGGAGIEDVTFDLPSGVEPLEITPNVSRLATGGIVNVPYPVEGPPGPPGSGGTWGTITGTLSAQTDLQTALDGKQAAGSYAAAVHTHAQSDVTGLTTALAGKAPSSHTHAQSDVTNLTSDLAGKAALSHSHAAADVTSGTFALARIGSGTAGAGKYVDGGTGAWTTLPASSGGTWGTITGTLSSQTDLQSALDAKNRFWVSTGAPVAGVGQTNDLYLDKSTGNIYTKINSTTWSLDTSLLADAIKKQIVDAKGDLIVATAADVVARLAIGTDGQVLTADSTQASGMKWAAAGGGGGVLDGVIPRASNHYLWPAISSDASASGASAHSNVTSVNFIPIFVPIEFDINGIVCVVGTAETIGAKMLLYRGSAADGLPETLVAETTIAITTTGNYTGTVSPAVTLTPGLYWAGVVTDGGSTVRFKATNALAAGSILQASVADTLIAPTFTRGTLPYGDIGSYATPNTTLTTIGFTNNGTANYPVLGLRRA